MARTSIWLVRHGQTEANRQRRYLGASESPLTPYGRMQVAALARRLQRLPFDVALVSPRERTRATAATILRDRDLPTRDDDRWREASHGRWEGLTYSEVCERFPHEARARFADGLHGKASDGESLAEVAERVAAAWAALLADHRNGRVLLVTHATPIQLILCLLSGASPALHWRWRVDLGSVTAIDVFGDAPIVRVVNEVPLLARTLDTHGSS